MSYQEPHSSPFPDPALSPVPQKSGWSGKKKAGVAVGSLAVLAGTFFVGTEVGYNDARNDISAAFDSAFNSDYPDASASGSLQDDTAEFPESSYPVVLTTGGSIDVPCSMFSPEDGTCMTITLTEVDPNAGCYSSYADPGRYVALTFDVSMPVEANPEFSSPFRSSPWSVSTQDRRMTTTDTEIACGDTATYLDLMAEFPGYSASGTAWLPVPDDASEIHFEVSHEPLINIPLG